MTYYAEDYNHKLVLLEATTHNDAIDEAIAIESNVLIKDVDKSSPMQSLQIHEHKKVFNYFEWLRTKLDELGFKGFEYVAPYRDGEIVISGEVFNKINEDSKLSLFSIATYVVKKLGGRTIFLDDSDIGKPVLLFKLSKVASLVEVANYFINLTTEEAVPDDEHELPYMFSLKHAVEDAMTWTRLGHKYCIIHIAGTEDDYKVYSYNPKAEKFNR